MLYRLGLWRLLALGFLFPPGLFALVIYDFAVVAGDSQASPEAKATRFFLTGVSFVGAIAWAMALATIFGLI